MSILISINSYKNGHFLEFLFDLKGKIKVFYKYTYNCIETHKCAEILWVKAQKSNSLFERINIKYQHRRGQKICSALVYHIP